MANKLIQDLTATAAVLSTDLWEKQPVAGPPSEKATIAQLITLLDTIYTQASGGPYLPLAGGTMVGNILFSADNTRDIGASGATRPRTGYWGTSLVAPLLDSPAATALSLASAGTIRANFSTAGHLLFNTDNTNDIGATGATRPRTGYFGTSVVSPLFTGALTGHASLDLALTGGTLTGGLLFSLDNTIDIGASGATRPRTGYFGTSVISPLFTGALTGAASLNVLKAGDTMTGALLFSPDNTVDIGATGATRPRTAYVATSVNVESAGSAATPSVKISTASPGIGLYAGSTSRLDMVIGAGANTHTFWSDASIYLNGANSEFKLGASGFIDWSGRASIYSPADSVIKLANQANNDFGRLQLGGTTSSFPAIKRNGAGIDFRLADDSEYASITTKNITQSVASLLSITSGTNQRAGNATLVGGTITVANTTVTANTVIMLTRKTSGGTIGTAITYTLSAATSFTINSDSVIDTSTFSYLLIEVP